MESIQDKTKIALHEVADFVSHKMGVDIRSTKRDREVVYGRTLYGYFVSWYFPSLSQEAAVSILPINRSTLSANMSNHGHLILDDYSYLVDEFRDWISTGGSVHIPYSLDRKIDDIKRMASRYKEMFNDIEEHLESVKKSCPDLFDKLSVISSNVKNNA